MEPVGMNRSDSSGEEYFSADDEENIRSNKATSRRSLQGSGKGKLADPGNALAFPADDHTEVQTVSEEARLEPSHHEQADKQGESSSPMHVTVVAVDHTGAAPSAIVKEATQSGAVTPRVREEEPTLVREEGPTSPEPQSDETPPKPPPRKKKKRRDQEEEERTTSFSGEVPTCHDRGAGAPFTLAAEPGRVDPSIAHGKVGVRPLCVQPATLPASTAIVMTTDSVAITTVSAASSSMPIITVTNANTTTKPPKPSRKHHTQTGISIEHDMELELTADMMCGSEVVTVDTTLAKAPGGEVDSNMAAVFFPSDDESTDGESLIVAEPSLISTGTIAEGGVVGGGHTSIRDSMGSTVTVVGPEEPGTSPGTSSPSDTQILQMTMVKNLDTGELIPLSAAEERIPRGWSNPLAEHLKQRTSELEGSTSGLQEEVGDVTGKRKPPISKKLKKIFKWKEEEQQGLSDDESEDHLKYKPSSHHKGPYDFDKVRLKQDLSGQHLGAVWVMEFSICGKLLATAGQDSVVRIWVLRTAYSFFHELQAKYQRMGVHSSGDSISEKESVASTNSSKSSEEDDANSTKPFLDHPLCSYYGHTADVLGMSWSKNFFILSSSMDKTVRLWHISRKECLCCFQHVDFVTAIAFHPRDDRYFLSGSLDGKLRLWNIPDKKVALWNEIEGVGSHLITAANFCANGKFAAVGTYDGRCIFYDTEHLKYHTQIHVRSRHGKNRGRKISGVEPLPGENKVLVTSNDSRVRLYNLVDHSLTCKYKGGINTNSQIKATFSRDGQYIISGSEDKYIYIWRTHNDVSKLPSTRRDLSELYESFSCHSAPVTTAIFAPVPGITVDEGLREVGHIIVAADYQGSIKVYVTGEVL